MNLLRYLGRGVLAAALGAAVAVPAYAQRVPAYQDGSDLVPGDALKFLTNGRYGKAGGLAGDAQGKGLNPFSITDLNALGLSTNSAATTGAYNALGLGHDTSGNPLLSWASYGEAAKALQVTADGTTIATANATGWALLGTPTAPTPSGGAGSTQVATVGYVASSVGAASVAALPWVSTDTALAALSGATASRAIRGGASAVGDAPALTFWNKSGTCADNGFVSDKGHCRDADDGTSWITTQSFLDMRDFGPPSHGSDATAQIQKAINYAASSGLVLYNPMELDFTSLTIPPGLQMVCMGQAATFHRTAVGYGMTTVTLGDAYPTAAIQRGPQIKNCVMDGGGLAGSNLTIAGAQRTILEDFDSYGAGSIASSAEANISITSSVMTVNTLNKGTIATGQVILCKSCARSSNRYSTVGSQVDATHWNVTGPSDLTGQEAVFSPPWTYTDSLGDKVLPTANVTLLGNNLNNLTYTRWNRGVVGSRWTTIGEATCVFSPVGILVDTTKSDGTEKLNHSIIAPKEASCLLMGLVLANGDDNDFSGISFQNTAYDILVGTGANGASRNKFDRPYVESGGTTTTYVGIAFANGASFNDVYGTGALNGVTTALIDTGFGNRWCQTTRVCIHSGDPVEPLVDTFYSGATLANSTNFNGMVTQTFARLLDGPDEQNVASNIVAYGTSHTASMMLGRTRGTHGSLAAVSSGDILGYYGFYGQYDTTNGHMTEAARIEGSTTQDWSSGHTGAQLIFRVTANDASMAGAWAMDDDLSFHAFGLNGRGAGVISGKLIQPQTQYAGSGGSAIPTCNSAMAGSIATVSDGKTSPTYLSAYAAADGAKQRSVVCLENAWVYN